MTKKDGNPVGYGKPPLHSRFKPGQSGNPKGRPRGRLNFASDLKRVLEAPVSVTEGGKSRKVSTQEGVLLRLANKALNGSDRAMDKYLSLAEAHFAKNAEITSKTLSADDQAILEQFRQELLAEASASQDKIRDEDDT
ncbi:DUF5681 domain-containing protein [Bradyrhizobium sp. UNPA324]|uniref:DUF5681 domain-containing protein n=1 Tax=Bradyrhizobium sp. UNPA324 TaxID=1141174 RepID=UPI00114FB6A2|nr:DUF5681 domain-containing protein [Bradyrhizobium sp. UNPA324]TQF33475.1 hypothetical protein UNPA324_30965 [Bradyrhizobium sp. UNPA324]